MTVINFLGEQVRHDRLSGTPRLTMHKLIKRLNEMEDRPIDPFTEVKKKAYFSWVCNIEKGKLVRDLTPEVRRWLARALNGDEDQYLRLPIQNPIKNSVTIEDPDTDLLPLIKYLAKTKSQTLTGARLSLFCAAYTKCVKLGLTGSELKAFLTAMIKKKS